MKKLLKILAWTLGSLLTLLIVAVIAITLLFDPNQYKDDIIQAVKAATGRELKIDGELSWTLFPWLGVKAEGLTLGNAPGFGPQPFSKVGAAGVSVELLPLLRGKVNVDTLHVRDLTLNLAHDAKGVSNWADLVGAKAPPAKPGPAPTEKAAPEALALVVGGVDIQRANLNYRDAASGTSYALRDLALRTGRIAAGEAIDTQLSGTIEHGKPVQQIKLELRTALALSDNALAFRDLKLGVDDSTVTGKIEIADLKKNALRFDLALDAIDVDRYLATAPADKAKAAPTVKGAATPAAAPVAIPVSTLRGLDAQGKLRIGKLKAMGIRSSDITVQMAAKNGVLTLGPNGATLYGGRYSGTTELDVRGNTPRLKLEEKLERVQLGPFLRDADLFDAFSGEGNVQLKLTAVGGEADAIKRTLNGTAMVAIKDGAIEGIDLVKMENQIKEARRQAGDNLQKLLAALPALKPEKGDKTTFTKLGASAVVTNGVVANDDLAVEGPHIHVRGRGRVNLVTEQFDNYVLRVSEVPLIVTGAFADPKIRPDWNAIAKDALKEMKEEKKEELKQKGKEKLRDLLKKR